MSQSPFLARMFSMSNDKKTEKADTNSYKGVRDFYPTDWQNEIAIFDIWRKSAESFGYQEYNASILELAELYRAKTSNEIVNEQTYTFIDRGGREVTLRPEMTPTVARMVAARHRELSFPLRWYSIANVFRYERPQRGRLREHWQLNCDLFGISSLEADTEIISLAYQILKSFGAKDADFEIRISDRNILTVWLRDILKQTPESVRNILRLHDKRNKITADDFRKTLLEDTGDESATQKIIEGPENIISANKELSDINQYISAVKENLNKSETNNVKIDYGLTRGFDYYTGMIFEIYDINPKNNRSLFGGGRYDNLLQTFSKQPIPAVGFGMGDVTILDFLESRGSLPKYCSKTHLYICHTTTEFIDECANLAKRLRNQGLNISVDLSNQKVGDQVKTAAKQNVPFIVCIGEEEMKSGTFKLKNLDKKVENQVTEDKIPEFIKNTLNAENSN